MVYKDSDYKHKKDVVAAPKTSAAPSASVSSSEAAPTGQAAEEGSDNTMLFGLIALAAVGFYFFRKGSAGQPKAAAGAVAARSAYAGEEGGLTGVAKYLAEKEEKSTGVAKYLASKEEKPATGVAKYMAKQVVAARQAAAEKATGVEKYLRNKG
nr:hypothetical protein [Methylomarinum sp. Ch1-1]MDP4521762.1 hypothetical protein [Methylomarinum sp. Ch1-1]